jgi:hypothetical protein
MYHYMSHRSGHLVTVGRGSEFSWPIWLARASRLVPYLAPILEADAHDAVPPLVPGAVLATLFLGVADSRLGFSHRQLPRHLQLPDLDHGWVRRSSAGGTVRSVELLARVSRASRAGVVS